MMLTLGSDPDTHHLALAVVETGPRGPELMFYWQSDVKKKIVGDDAVAEVARQLAALDSPFLRLCEMDVVAVEQMQVYPGKGKQGADTLGKSGIDGLIRVASTGGVALAWAMARWPSARYAMPLATNWKGQSSKPASHKASVGKLLENKTKQDLMALPASRRGHLLDAVGIALWAAGDRFTQRETRKDIMASARANARKARGRKS